MNEPAVFFTQSDVRSLLAAPEAGSLTLPPLGLLAAQPRMQRLQVVADHASFASFCRIDSFDERVRTAVTAALDSSVEVSTVVLGHGIADAAAIHPLDGNSQPLFDQGPQSRPFPRSDFPGCFEKRISNIDCRFHMANHII